MDYKKAGVDIEAGYKSVELMKKHVMETMRPEVLGGIGGFSGAFSLKAISPSWSIKAPSKIINILTSLFAFSFLNPVAPEDACTKPLCS